MKLHFRDIRLYNNAGMTFPTCQANAKLIDCDKGRWETSGNIKEVTCKHCLNKITKEYSK